MRRHGVRLLALCIAAQRWRLARAYLEDPEAIVIDGMRMTSVCLAALSSTAC